MKKFAIATTLVGMLALSSGCAQVQRLRAAHSGVVKAPKCNDHDERWAWVDNHTQVVSSSECDLLRAGFKPSEILTTDPLHRVWVMVKNPFPENGYAGCIETTEQVREEEGWQLCGS